MIGQEVFKNISEEACRALESVVGPEYLSTDPVLCSAYVGRGFDRQIFLFNEISRAPAAVIMPENTEQVARIVKVCNLYKIPFTPMSSYGMAFGGPNFRDDFLFIDLKRMNHMWLDEKNMYVVLEPAVYFAQMHGDTLKRGLIGCVPGGGGGTSVLANSLVNGMGLFNYRITYAAQRRWNGIEWVSPEGEIYRFGSLVAGDDSWFWQDGPGPNLSGLLHGITGWGGAMGIVTKMSTKLYPYPPRKLEPEGISYDSCVKLPEDREKWYNFSFSNEADVEKALDEIARARIGFIVNRVPSFWRDIARTRGDLAYRNRFWELWEPQTREEVSGRRILRVLLVGRSGQAELEYEERVLMDIVNENNGKLLKARQVDEASFFAVNSLGMWQPTGMFGDCDTGMETMKAIREMGERWRKRETEKEYTADFLDPKGDTPWYMAYNMGRLYYSELHAWPDAAQMDRGDKAEHKPGLEDRFMRWRVSEAGRIIIETGNQGFFYSLVTPVRVFAPALQNYDVWLDRMKAEFDPNGISAPGHPYIFDEIVDKVFPGAITDELKDAVKKVAEGPWNGNPEK
ncbi:MAG: FAD-binding oxidoreductase [Dehalococcoidia bacterium]|nr:MAG: FAD-binding oxidoreductase [Dehalococcoidia bacterium]